VWLTLASSMRTTVVLTDGQAAELAASIRAAAG